jgi:hypothetical protein
LGFVSFFKFSLGTSNRLESDLDAVSLPEMVFGHNFLEVVHSPSNFKLSFNAREALGCWRAAPWYHTALHVACADLWSESRDHPEDMAAEKKHDWTFTTPYIGLIEFFRAVFFVESCILGQEMFRFLIERISKNQKWRALKKR